MNILLYRFQQAARKVPSMPRLHPRVPPPPPPRPRRPRAVQLLLNRCRWSRIGTRYPRFRKAQICGKSCTTAKVLYLFTFQQPQQYLLTCLLTHNFLATHFLAFTQGNLEHISSQIENLLASSQRQKDDMDRLADMMRKQKNTMHMFKEAAGACSLFFM